MRMTMPNRPNSFLSRCIASLPQGLDLVTRWLNGLVRGRFCNPNTSDLCIWRVVPRLSLPKPVGNIHSRDSHLPHFCQIAFCIIGIELRLGVRSRDLVSAQTCPSC